MPHGITQCYLPPGRGDIPVFTPAKAGTRFSNPGGMQGWVDPDWVDSYCSGDETFQTVKLKLRDVVLQRQDLCGTNRLHRSWSWRTSLVRWSRNFETIPWTHNEWMARVDLARLVYRSPLDDGRPVCLRVRSEQHARSQHHVWSDSCVPTVVLIHRRNRH